MQQLSKAGAAFVRTLEGVVLKAYYDNATPPVLTIGIGATWASAAFRKWWGKNRPGKKFDTSAVITRTEADEMLMLMFDEEYGAAVAKFLGKDVEPHVFDGTASPVFNLGTGSLKWRWAAAVKAGDLDAAAALLKATGTTAGGKVLKGLVTRRKEEAELISTGDYAIGGKAPVAAEPDAMADGALRRGERGDAVKKLQADLRTLGLYDQTVDGIFGYGTEASVLAFQRQSAALDDDGVAGGKTLKALAAALVGAPEPVVVTAADLPRDLEAAPPASPGAAAGTAPAIPAPPIDEAPIGTVDQYLTIIEASTAAIRHIRAGQE